MRAYTQRKGARYYVVVEEGQGPDGKRKRSWHSGYKTKKEAEDGLTTILSALQGDTYSSPTKLTVTDFLKQTWLPAMRKTVGPNTASLYRVIVGAYIIPRIGGIELQRLRPSHLDGLYDELLVAGGRRGKPLSPKSVRNVHTTLYKAMSDAVRLGRISRNPVELASPSPIRLPGDEHLDRRKGSRVPGPRRRRSALRGVVDVSHDRSPPWRASRGDVEGRQLQRCPAVHPPKPRPSRWGAPRPTTQDEEKPTYRPYP